MNSTSFIESRQLDSASWIFAGCLSFRRAFYAMRDRVTDQMQQRIGDCISERLVDTHVAAYDFKLNLFLELARRHPSAASGRAGQHFTGRHETQLYQSLFKFDKPPPQMAISILKRRFVSGRVQGQKCVAGITK